MQSITFISFEQHYYERHQFYCLSAYLKSKGFKISYISESQFDFNKVIKRLKADQPDLLGYSAYSATKDTYIKFDKLQKDITGIQSIIGGSGAIFNHDFFANTTIDAVCIGEGEDALVQYLQTDGRAAKNIVTHDRAGGYNPLVDLDQMPFPEREIVYEQEPYLKKMKYRMFLSGRGCPFNCSYCHNHIFNNRFKDYGKVVRKKSVDYFIEEIRQVDARYDPRLIVMQDDTFILGKEWLFEFCKKYKRGINKPFACNIRANLVDQDVVRNLKEAGCVCCNWSIETGNDYLRNAILKRNISKDEIINTANLLNKYGIKHRIGNIIGIPHETEDNLKETIELNIRSRPYFALANTLIPYAGLKITDYAVKSGYLDANFTIPDVTWSLSVLKFPRDDKIRFLRTVYLFPLFVNYPILYKNLLLRKMCYKVPIALLKYIHALTDLYKMHRLYPFGASLSDIMAIINRYLKYTISHSKYGK